MGISEHLSAELRSDYFQGTTAPGAALAVEAHIASCEQCRRASAWAERFVWSATSQASPDQGLGRPRAVDDHPTTTLPARLGRIAKGRWRRVTEGVRRAPLRGVSGLGESVHLLEAEADAPLRVPAAAHLLLVLRGAVRTAAGAYLAGDLIEAAGARLKEARAHAASGCLCLVVGDDDLYEHLLADGLVRLRA